MFARLTPRVLFDSVSVAGVNADQSRYLSYLFNRGGQAPLRTEADGERLLQGLQLPTARFSNLCPQARFGARGNNTLLLLDARVKRPWSIGVEGLDHEQFQLHAISQSRFPCAGLQLSRRIDWRLDRTVVLCRGMLSARFSLRTRVPSFRFDGVLQRQKFFDNEVLFYKTPSPAFITEVDNFARASFVWAIGAQDARHREPCGWLYS